MKINKQLKYFHVLNVANSSYFSGKPGVWYGGFTFCCDPRVLFTVLSHIPSPHPPQAILAPRLSSLRYIETPS
jgi:hypothetical protein